jgi:hypothetical protein
MAPPSRGHASPLWAKPVRKLTVTRAAASGALPSVEPPASLLQRIKGLGKGLAVGLPAAALSTFSGGMLAGSLHAVTGTPTIVSTFLH